MRKEIKEHGKGNKRAWERGYNSVRRAIKENEKGDKRQ